MTCSHQTFHPTNPCCGAHQLCKSFPLIDWSRCSWLVTTPDAELLMAVAGEEYRTGGLSFLSSLGGGGGLVWNLGWDGLEGVVADLEEPSFGGGGGGGGFPPSVAFPFSGERYRGDQFIAQHAGQCAWSVWNREGLIPANYSVISAWKTRPEDSAVLFWNQGGVTLLEAAQKDYWQSLEIQYSGGTIAPNTLTYDHGSEPWMVSWSDLLQRTECHWLPYFAARADISQVNSDMVPLLNAVREALTVGGPAIHDLTNSDKLFKPTALELAASAYLRPGLTFGVVNDRRSPLFGEFTIFEDATYDDDGDPESGWIVGVAWDSVTGPVRAEFGVVNCFERANNNRTLPAWVTLELILV